MVDLEWVFGFFFWSLREIFLSWRTGMLVWKSSLVLRSKKLLLSFGGTVLLDFWASPFYLVSVLVMVQVEEIVLSKQLLHAECLQWLDFLVWTFCCLKIVCRLLDLGVVICCFLRTPPPLMSFCLLLENIRFGELIIIWFRELPEGVLLE